MKYEEFKNNDYLQRMVDELNRDGAGIIIGTIDELIEWGRSNSLWSLTFGTSCCAIEFMALGAARYDMARFGFEVTRNSPRQADMIMVLGTITYKMAPVLKRLYDQMAELNMSLLSAGCTISGGPFIFQVLPRSQRNRQDYSGGCLHTGMSSASGSFLLRHDAIASVK